MIRRYNILSIIASLLLVVSCGKDNISYGTDSEDQSSSGEYGYLVLPDEVFVDLSSETFNQTKSSDMIEASDDYIVYIENTSTGAIGYSGSYGDLKALDELALRPGSYTMSISSIDEVPAVGSTAHYAVDKDFAIVSGMTTTIDELSCTMSNIKVSLSYSADLLDLFKEDSEENPEENFNIKASIGDNSANYTRSNSGQVYYFRAEDQSNSLELELSGMYNSAAANEEPNYTMIESWKQTIENVKAGQWRNITINVEYANQGNVNFLITIDTWTYNQGLDVDITSSVFMLSNVLVEPELDDPENYISDANAPTVTLGLGQESLEKIFYVDYSIFELSTSLVATCKDPIILNVEPQGTATLTDMWVEFSSDNQEFNALLESALGQKRREYILPSETSSIYYSIDGNTFEASYEGMRMLYLYSGTHEMTIMTKDSQGRTSYNSLTIVSSNDGVELPESSGPTIVWRGGNSFDNTYTIDPINGLEVIIDITSTTGITGFTIEIDSETLTETALTDINLAKKMDLINPGSCEDGLTTLDFPTGENVEGKTSLEFDISSFMPMLILMGEGSSNFTLEVSDASGTTTKTLKVKVE